jgi:4-carboxymuconolactone decarboxylase
MKSVAFLIGACILFSMSGIAEAQDRMPPIPRDKMTEAQKKAADEVASGQRGGGNRTSGPFVPLLRSPELMSRLQKIGEYLRFNSSLEPKLLEFVILMTARQWTQQYEWDAHASLAVKAGVEPEIIAAIAEGRRPAKMTGDEEIVYAFYAELHQNQSVSDPTYGAAVNRFGEQGVIDMVGLIGYYSTLGMVMNVARAPLPPGTAQPLVSFPH